MHRRFRNASSAEAISAGSSLARVDKRSHRRQGRIRGILGGHLHAALLIQREQAFQDLLVGGVGGIVGPTVGGPHGAVEGGVEIGEPGWAGVVEIGQGALFQVRFGRNWRSLVNRNALFSILTSISLPRYSLI